MGRRGPLPRDRALKIAGGETRPSRLDGAPKSKAPAFPVGAPRKPEGLPPDASAEWDLIVRALLERGTITPGDGGALEMLVQAGSIARKYLAAALAPDAPPRTFTRAMQSVKLYTRLLAEFGLDPASRARIAPARTPVEADPMADFLAKQEALMEGPPTPPRRPRGGA